MADTDRLLTRNETIAESDDEMLNTFREFEPQVGIRQNFFDHSVWYSEVQPFMFWASGLVQEDTEDNGIEVLNYSLGTSAPITPDRHKIIPQKDYVGGITLYYNSISGEPGAFEDDPTVPTTDEGNIINYKANIYFGWQHGNDDGTICNNPFFGLSSSPPTNSTQNYNNLTALKNILESHYYPTNKPESYAFFEIYNRYSDNYIYGNGWDNNYPTSNKHFTGFRFYCVHGGKKRTMQDAHFKGPWINTRDTDLPYGNTTYHLSVLSRQTNFIIPGDPYDQTDPNTYWIYGILATNYPLNSNAYIKLRAPWDVSNNCDIPLQYFGDDNSFRLSGGQTTRSDSGYLNFSSSTQQDRIDGLEYIYIFRKLINRGFINENYPYGAGLVLYGLWNQHWWLKINITFRITPYNWGTYPMTKTLYVKLRNTRNNDEVEINLTTSADMTSSGPVGGIVTFVFYKSSSTVNGNSSTYSATASPNTLNWTIHYGDRINIDSVKLGGSNGTPYNFTPNYKILYPSGTYNYIQLNLGYEYGSQSSSNIILKQDTITTTMTN